jgi:hypothetical protein
VSYARVGLANISEICKLGLENSTQHDNTCLTGPAVQITGETKCFDKGKNYINVIKEAKAPNGTYFACQGGIHTCYPGEDCVLVFLVPDLDILPGTEVAQYLNQQTEGRTHFQQNPILLPVLLGVALAGAMATEATAIGLQQVQHSQLSEKIHEDLGLVQQSIVTLQNQLDSLAAVVLQNHRGLYLITVEKGGNLCISRGRMLLLCKPVRNSERKCSPVARKNQGKKPGNILECRVEELGPLGTSPGGPTHYITLTTTPRASYDKPPHQFHSQPHGHS